MNNETTTRIRLDDGKMLELLDDFANFIYPDDGIHHASETGYTLEEVLNMRRLGSKDEIVNFVPVTPHEMSKLLHAEGLPNHKYQCYPRNVYWTSQGIGLSNPQSKFKGNWILAKLKLVPRMDDVTTTKLYDENHEEAGERITHVKREQKVTLDYGTAVSVPELLMNELRGSCTRAHSRKHLEYVQTWEEIGKEVYFPRHGTVDKGLGSLSLVDGRFSLIDSPWSCMAFVCQRDMLVDRFTTYDVNMNPKANWGQGYNSCWLKRVR
jgi:hypothetical protein